MKIYGDPISGNCLKVKWTCDHLGIAYDWVPVDVVAGDARTPEFLARFPQGQVPAIELADGRRLAQSNAIIRYLARGSALLPDDGFTQAKIDEWLFWEQYSHEPYIAVLRFQMRFQGKTKEARDAWRVERGERALDLEQHLARSAYFTGDSLTLADIALVAYTRLAGEGGFDLTGYRHVARWIWQTESDLCIEHAALTT